MDLKNDFEKLSLVDSQMDRVLLQLKSIFALFSLNSNTTPGSGPNSISNNTDSNPNKNHQPPVSVEETTLNQTHDSVLGHNTTNDSSGSNNVVKRSPR